MAKRRALGTSAADFLPARLTWTDLRQASAGCRGCPLRQSFKVTERRGELIEQGGQRYVATVHPSSILRAPDSETRHAETARLVEDLKRVREWVEK